MADIDPSSAANSIWYRVLPAVAAGTLLLSACSSSDGPPEASSTTLSVETQQNQAAQHTLEQTLDRLGMEKLEQFTMSSGIEALIYSDGDVQIDETAFEKSFHAALLLGDQMNDPNIPEMNGGMKALYDRVFGNRELAGKTVHFFIASNPNDCIKDKELVPRGNAPALDVCETQAETLSIVLQGGNLVSQADNIQILVSAGTLNDEVLTHPFGRDFTLNSEQAMASGLTHEGFHATLRMLGIPRPTAEEDLTQLVEAEVLEYYGAHPEEQPIPVKFPRAG